MWVRSAQQQKTAPGGIYGKSSTMERNLHCFSAQMGPNFLPLCILPSLFLPTTCPRTKPALLHLTAACGKTFLLSLLRHSSRFKNATFLSLLPRSCWQLLRAHVRGGAEALEAGTAQGRRPGQPHPHLGLIHARTHPVWMEQQLHARDSAVPGHWESTRVTQALSTAHSSTGPRAYTSDALILLHW